MRGKIKSICAIGCIMLALSGCSGDGSTSDQPDEVTKANDDVTIFDKIVNGEMIGESISLYDISEMVRIEDARLMSVCAYGSNYIIALYSGEERSQIIVYDISDGDVYKKIELDNLLSEEAYVDTAGSGIPYIYDETERLFYTLNVKNEKYAEYLFEFEPEDILVSDSGNRIYYTMPDDVCIYQYKTETNQSSVAYDVSEQADKVMLESVNDDDTTLIVKILTDGQEKYAKLSVEMQQLDILYDYKGELYYADGDYVYTSEDYPKSVCIYDELKPRNFLKFELEEEAELERMYVYPDGPCIFTIADDEGSSVIRFYNVAGGIMENETVLPSDYTITRVSYMKDFRAMCLTTTDSDGNTGAVIWDVEAISSIIS